MKAIVYNQQGEKSGEVELNDKIFGVKTSTHVLAEAVRIQQSNARVGLANTKTRGEVSGGGKKPWKQKGTGRARHGSTRSPIWRHGGIAFGPTSDRNWELKINKKAKTKALFMSLSDKATEGKLILIDKLDIKDLKTKEFTKFLKAIEKSTGSIGKTQLFVMPNNDKTLIRPSRNIAGVKPNSANSLNIVDVIKADVLIALKDSLPVIEKTYLKGQK